MYPLENNQAYAGVFTPIANPVATSVSVSQSSKRLLDRPTEPTPKSLAARKIEQIPSSVVNPLNGFFCENSSSSYKMDLAADTAASPRFIQSYLEINDKISDTKEPASLSDESISRMLFLIQHPESVDHLFNENFETLNESDYNAMLYLVGGDYKNYLILKEFVINSSKAAELYCKALESREDNDEKDKLSIQEFLPSIFITEEKDKKSYLKKLCELNPEDALNLLCELKIFPDIDYFIDRAIKSFRIFYEKPYYCYPFIFFNLDLSLERIKFHFFKNFHYAVIYADQEKLVDPKLRFYIAQYDKYVFDKGENALKTFKNLLKNYPLRHLAFPRLHHSVVGPKKDFILSDLINREPLQIASMIESAPDDSLKNEKLILEICQKKYLKGRNILHELGINAYDYIKKSVRAKISEFFKRQENQELFKTYLMEKDELGMTPLEYALLPPLDETVIYKFEILLPDHFKNSIFEAIFKLPKNCYPVVIERIYERAPEVITQGRIDTDILNFLTMLEKLDLETIYSMMAWEFNMNQALPLSVEALDLIKQYSVRNSESSEIAYSLPVGVQLAFQVHSNFQELKTVLSLSLFNENFPKSEEFNKLSLNKKKEWLLHAVVYRDKNSIPSARTLVKDARQGNIVDEELLQLALRIYIENGIEPSKRTSDYLTSLIINDRLCVKTRVFAIKAFVGVCTTLEIENYKPLLLDVLIKAADTDLQIALIDALAKQTHLISEEITKILLNHLLSLTQSTNDISLLQSIAFLLTVIPIESALKAALNIVLSSVWDLLDRDEYLNKFAKCSDFYTFIKRPLSHDNRHNMKRIIAYRLAEIYESCIQKNAESLFYNYRNQIVFDQNLENISLNFFNLPTNIRYLPFMFFLPSDRHLFRGLQGVGKEAFKNAAEDLIVKGSNKASLINFTKANESIWVKLGFAFATISKKYLESFFDDQGIVLVLPTQFFNENQLRRQVRYETEGAIHGISYMPVRPEHFSKLYISSVHKPFIENHVASLELAHEQKMLPHQKRFLRKLTSASSGDGTPIRDRISYFDQTADVWTQISTSGFEEISFDNVIEATLSKHCRLIELAKVIEDVQFKDLLIEVQKVPYLWEDAYKF